MHTYSCKDLPCRWWWPSYRRGVGRKVDVDDLVGTREITERLGLSRPQLVHDWRRRYDSFPEPLTTVSSVCVWSWRDVQRWLRSTGR
jgi:predicted DNA-binding transcriptional regulator AlpA